MNVPKLRFPEFSGEWEEKGFYDIFDILQNNTFSRNQLNNETGNVYNIHYGDVLIKFGDYIDCQKEKLPFINIDNNLSKYNQESYIRNGDIIIADTAEDYSAGKVTEICNVNNLQILSGLHTFLARPKKKFASKFLGYKMNSNSYHNQVAPLVAGTKVYSINRKAIAETSISYPTRLEQQKIADFLSTVDSIIASETKILNALQKKKKALMQKLFSQQIRFKADDGSEFPEWVEKKLEDLCTVNQGLQIAIEDRLKEQEENSYFYITNEFIKTGTKYKYYIKNPPKTVICNEDDILMTRTGNTGIVVTNIAGCFHNNFFKINYDRKFIVKQFFVQFFKLPETKHRILVLAGLSTIPDLNHKDFYSLRINLPCKEEQQKIADCLSSLDNQIQNQQKIVSNWQQRKKGLLQQMFI